MPFRDDTVAREARLDALRQEATALARRGDEARERAAAHRDRLDALRRQAIGESRNRWRNSAIWGAACAGAFGVGAVFHVIAEGPAAIVVGGVLALGVLLRGWRIHRAREAGIGSRAERLDEALEDAATVRARVAPHASGEGREPSAEAGPQLLEVEAERSRSGIGRRAR